MYCNKGYCSSTRLTRYRATPRPLNIECYSLLYSRVFLKVNIECYSLLYSRVFLKVNIECYSVLYIVGYSSGVLYINRIDYTYERHPDMSDTDHEM